MVPVGLSTIPKTAGKNSFRNLGSRRFKISLISTSSYMFISAIIHSIYIEIYTLVLLKTSLTAETTFPRKA